MPVEFFEASPFVCRMPAGQLETPRPAGRTLTEALTHVAPQFARDPFTGTAHLMTGTVEHGVSDSARLLRIDPGTLLVVGLTPLADQARTLLVDGVLPSWRPHELPATRTSVSTLKPLLPTQMYNILLTHQFATVEEVAAVPAASWSEFHHVGDKFVAALERALADAAPPAPAEPVPGDTADRDEFPPSDVVRRVAASFEGHRSKYEQWECAGSSSSRWGSAWVCRIHPGRVLHVVGASAMAESLRELLGRGEVVGWSLQPMAETRTPLHEYFPQFQDNDDAADARGYKQLDVAGFAFGEEVAACPDDVLLAIRNIGPKALATIRRIIGSPPPKATPAAYRVHPRVARSRRSRSRRAGRSHRGDADAGGPGAVPGAHRRAGGLGDAGFGGEQDCRVARGRADTAGRSDGDAAAGDRR